MDSEDESLVEGLSSAKWGKNVKNWLKKRVIQMLNDNLPPFINDRATQNMIFFIIGLLSVLSNFTQCIGVKPIFRRTFFLTLIDYNMTVLSNVLLFSLLVKWMSILLDGLTFIPTTNQSSTQTTTYLKMILD